MRRGVNPSPGVYVREIDLSERIRSISTSICAIVGPSAQGNINERVLVTSKSEFWAKFGRANPRVSHLHYHVERMLEQSDRVYVTRVANDDENRGALPLTAGALYSVDQPDATIPRPSLDVWGGANDPQGIYDPNENYVFDPNDPAIQNKLFAVWALNPGEWNNRLYVSVNSVKKPGTAAINPEYEDPYSFIVRVYVDYKNSRSRPVEEFLVKRTYDFDGYGNQLYIEDVINTYSSYIRVRNNPLAPNVKVLEDANVFFAGGTNGGFVSYTQIRKAWDLYSDPEQIDVNLLVQGGQAPGISNLTDIADIQRKMIEIAENRMDCVALLDIPFSEEEVSRAITYRENELNANSSYAALYTGHIKVRDAYNGIDVNIALSSSAAAICALTDNDAAVWFDPAGMNRGSVDCISSRIYNQGMRNALHEAQINCMKYFRDGSGYKMWNALTLQRQASALSWLNVRRLLCYIEKSIAIAQQYSIFDPNSESLRSRIQSTAEAFLQPIKDAGGLYYFKAQCDNENNPPESIANGDLILDIAVDPVICAKRILLTCILVKTGTYFNEGGA